MAVTLTISDGTDSVSFAADSDYGLLGWPLRIAPQRRSKAGFRSPYEPVTERLKIFIMSDSVVDAHEKLRTLIRLLNKSQRFADGELNAGEVVYIDYQANTGAFAKVWRALIFGNDNKPMVFLPENYTLVNVIQSVDNLEIEFIREGLWTASESSGIGDLLNRDGVEEYDYSLQNNDFECPVNMSTLLSNDSTGAKAFFFVAAAARMNNVAGYGSQTSKSATTTSPQSHTVPTLSGASAEGPVRTIVKIKNNSSIVSWDVWVAQGLGLETRKITIAAGDTEIKLLSFPPISTAAVGTQTLYVQASEVDASETISIGETLTIQGNASVIYAEVGEGGSGALVNCDDNFVTQRSPSISGGAISIKSAGDIILFSPAERTSLYAGFIAIGIDSGSTTWYCEGATSNSAGMLVDRRAATILPD